MCSIPGGEPESLENDDQLDPEVASYEPSTGLALFLCCCWIRLLFNDTIASTNH